MRLSPVLGDADLSPVELQAARLDGEVYELAGAFCLIGEIEAPAHRARAVLGGRSPRLIAELGTAAWIWGAAAEPLRLEFAVTPDARARLVPAEQITVREIVYERDDVCVLDGFSVTTPLRTILDLARFTEPFDAAAATGLAEIGGLDADDCREALASRRGIPAKRRAERRLRALFERPGGRAVRSSGG
ncbi:hypothetical protein [Pseudolysinimonas sp.]|jgi:hypothetical protein|uniref:hypothetical protein n=1 Tax=Pseudolysinimonas sp. TaxID=2680009 RepID=UPI0037840FF7